MSFGCQPAMREELPTELYRERWMEEGSHSIAEAVLVAYKTNREIRQANPEWKIHAALALRSLLQLQRTCPPPSFCDESSWRAGGGHDYALYRYLTFGDLAI